MVKPDVPPTVDSSVVFTGETVSCTVCLEYPEFSIPSLVPSAAIECTGSTVIVIISHNELHYAV